MKKVGLFFGGLGNEAEVSVVSAKNVFANIDQEKYETVLVYWHTDGAFYRVSDFNEIVSPTERIREQEFKNIFDVALPMTHGRFGEDGVLQALFERLGVPYAGCRVLSSALCMDKAVCKTFLSGQRIPQTRFKVIDFSLLTPSELESKFEEVKNSFFTPVFVKPANSGSSVGISKVDDMSDLARAIAEARKHDTKIVIEEGLVGLREVEVGILGNGHLITSWPGELILPKEFYDYDEKYKNNRTEVRIPARLSIELEQEIMALAQMVYRLCDCRGFARIDFFVANNKVYLNEINTLPGFTQFSMYPLLLMKMGLSYGELVSRIIDLAY
ncbi:D-alanine--D-alanine ligase [Candidatus Falkowbacteria bacterium]|nr:D-alanine--D-alanine ligase [Candidatus Falkowbacteria bacterium]